MTIDDMDDVRARLEDGHARMERMRVGSAQGVDRADLRALLDDHARLARDPLWQRAYNEALRHHHEVEAERNAARAEVERLTRERDEYKACWLRDVEKGRAAEERLRAERVKASAAWSSSHAALVGDRDRLAAALAEVRAGVTRVVHLALHDSDEGTEWSDELEDAARRAHAVLAATPADLAAAHDARVRAEALREAAERAGVKGASWTRGAFRRALQTWLRAEADRIERGGR